LSKSNKTELVVEYHEYRKKYKKDLSILRLLDVDWPHSIDTIQQVMKHISSDFESENGVMIFESLNLALNKYSEAIDLDDALRFYMFISIFFTSIAESVGNIQVISKLRKKNIWTVRSEESYQEWKRCNPGECEFTELGHQYNADALSRTLQERYLSDSVLEYINKVENRSVGNEK